MLTRLLPLVTVAAWAAMLWVPIVDSGDDGVPVGIVITSLGGDVLDLESARPAFLLIWIGVLTAAVTVWLVRSLTSWSSAVTVLGALALIRLITMLGDPPRITWDGTAADGRRAFAEVVAEPAPGALLWTAGSLCLIAAGICGLVEQRRRDRRRLNRRNRRSVDGTIRITPRGALAGRCSRWLPLVTVAAWVVMIWVPIFDSGTPGQNGLVVTSFGQRPIRISELGAEVLLPWAAILALAAAVWLFDPLAWVSPLLALTGAALFVLLLVNLADPPSLQWHGADPKGRPIGTTIVGWPAAGVSFWALGSGALVAAGVCGFIADRRKWG